MAVEESAYLGQKLSKTPDFEAQTLDKGVTIPYNDYRIKGIGGKEMTRPEILHGALSPHQREIGLSLSIAPANPSLLNLIYEGYIKKSFPAQTVTIPEIQEVACKIEEEVA